MDSKFLVAARSVTCFGENCPLMTASRFRESWCRVSKLKPIRNDLKGVELVQCVVPQASALSKRSAMINLISAELVIRRPRLHPIPDFFTSSRPTWSSTVLPCLPTLFRNHIGGTLALAEKNRGSGPHPEYDSSGSGYAPD